MAERPETPSEHGETETPRAPSDSFGHDDEMTSLRLGEKVETGTQRDGVFAANPPPQGSLDPYPDIEGWESPSDEKVRELAAAHGAGSIDLHTLVARTSGVSWGVCDWGSCQYSMAQAMCKTLARLQEAGLDGPEVVGWGPLDQLAPPERARTLEECLERISAGLCEEEMEQTQGGADPDRIREYEALTQSSDLGPAFEAMRERAWDLWTAASHTAQLVFGTTFEDISSRAKAAPSRGPAANVLVQSQNYLTGLQCHILAARGYVSDPLGPDTPFANFDT